MPDISAGSLPNGSMAHVEETKLRAYLLNLNHPEGGAKARFLLHFGFSLQDADSVRRALVVQGQTNPVIKQVLTGYGARYTVRCNCPTPDGRDPCIQTVWQMENGAPRLLTIIPR